MSINLEVVIHGAIKSVVSAMPRIQVHCGMIEVKIKHLG